MKFDQEEIHKILEGTAFGVTDGVICFSGLAIGVARSTLNPTLVVIATLVGGIADAFANAIGFYISQTTERNVQIHDNERGIQTHVHSKREVLMNGVFTFVSSLTVLLVLVSPFMIFNLWSAVTIMLALGIVITFALGAYCARINGENPIKSGAKYSCLTLIGAVLSYSLGEVLGIYFHYNVPA